MHDINPVNTAQLHGRIPINRVTDDEMIDRMCQTMRGEVLKKVPASADRIKVQWLWALAGIQTTPGFTSYPTWLAIFSLGSGYDALLITIKMQWTNEKIN